MNKKVTILFALLFVVTGLMPVAAQDDMAQVNKQTYLDAVTAYNIGDFEGFYTILTEPFMMNQGEAELFETTHDDVTGFDQALAAAIPDIQMTPTIVVAQGEWVAATVTYSGTFTEPYLFPPFGPNPFPPTNAPVSWTEMDFLHFNDDGLVSEVWVMSDPTVMFTALGVFPPQESDATGTLLETPAGYQTLSADELAATFTSGMEARNQQQLADEIAMGANVSSQFYADPYVNWTNAVPYSVTSEDAQSGQAFLDMLHQIMPDVTESTEIVVAEGDWVATLVKLNGTFTDDGDFFGMPLTHTDQPITWIFGGFNRYNADGLIVEQWIDGDPSPLLQGIGLMPAFGEE